MLRILVHEYLSTGQLAGSPGADSLLREGGAMLAAVAADLVRCPEVRVATLVAPELAARLAEAAPGIDLHVITSSEEEAVFRRLARGSDWALTIAPEFDDLLARRAEWSLEEGCRLLGPTPAAIRLTADKRQLAAHLAAHDIATPQTWDLRADCPFPVVIKPRCGAGCQETFLIRDASEFAEVQHSLPTDAIVQPWIEGVAASVAVLAAPSGYIILPPTYQTISLDAGKLSYGGGTLPVRPEHQAAIQALAGRVVEVVPGLHGYFGMDVIVNRDGVHIIEINPRLTTSYIGLRQFTRDNLASCLLDLMLQRVPHRLQWREAVEIQFFPDGSLVEKPS